MPAPLLFDHAAGKPVTGITRRLAFVIIGSGMDHQGSPDDARFALSKGHHRVEYLGAQCPVIADILVWHVAHMRSVFHEEAVLVRTGVEVSASGFMVRLGIALAGLVNVERNPLTCGKTSNLKLDQHAARSYLGK